MTRIKRVALALPAAFVLHVLEEAPLFVAWFNDRVTPPISQGTFLAVNAVAFVITLAVAVSLVALAPPLHGLLAAAWVGFLMLANGIFHIVATVAHSSYCPGVITGVLLYLPLSLVFMRSLTRETGLPATAVAGAALAGAMPMLAHGYLIVFRGSRLF